MALPLLSFYDKYFAQIKVLVMNEREVVVYFQADFETHKFTVNRLTVYCLTWMQICYSRFDRRNKKIGNFFQHDRQNSTSVTKVGLSTANLTVIAGFHQQVIENKIHNHSRNEICWCIIETSSDLPRKSSGIFRNLRTSSGIFRNSRKMSGNVCLAFGTILENLRKSLESGRKSSENHQKRRHQFFCYIIKRIVHVGFMFSRQEQYPTHSLLSLVRYCSCHSNIKFISSRHRVISSIYALYFHL